jgi:hypothetical protein
VEVRVTVLPTASSASVAGSAPRYSAGKSIAPTPMIAAWPAISLGTDITVPTVPGLVMVTVVSAKSATVSLLALTLPMSCS